MWLMLSVQNGTNNMSNYDKYHTADWLFLVLLFMQFKLV